MKNLAAILFLLALALPGYADSVIFVGSDNTDGSAKNDGSGTCYAEFDNGNPAAYDLEYHVYQTDGNGNTVDWLFGDSSGPYTADPEGDKRTLGPATATPFGPATIHLDAQDSGGPLVESSASYPSQTVGITVVGVYQVDAEGNFTPLSGATVYLTDQANGHFFSKTTPTVLRSNEGGGSEQQTYERFGIDPTGSVSSDAPYAPGPSIDNYLFSVTCPGYQPVSQGGAAHLVDVGASWPGEATVLLMSKLGSGVTTVPPGATPPIMNPVATPTPCTASSGGSGPYPSSTYTVTGFNEWDTGTGATWQVLNSSNDYVDAGQNGGAGSHGFTFSPGANGAAATLVIPDQATLTANNVAPGGSLAIYYKDSAGSWRTSITMLTGTAPAPCVATSPSNTTTDTSGNFLSNFWQQFLSYMQSLFVPQQSDLTDLKNAASQFANWGPFGLFSSLFADMQTAFNTPNGGATDDNYWEIPLYFSSYVGSPTDTASAPSDISEDPNGGMSAASPRSYGYDTTGEIGVLMQPIEDTTNPNQPSQSPGMFPMYMDCGPLSYVILKARLLVLWSAWGMFLASLYRWVIPKLRVKL